jgi:hypothetical protein
MFWKRKEKWFDLKNKKPEIGIEVLFTDCQRIWIGKILNYQNSKSFFIFLSQNEQFGWNWEYRNNQPLFWRHLPCRPERLNPEDASF